MGVRNICCIGAGSRAVLFSAVIASKCPNVMVTIADSDSKKIERWNSQEIPLADLEAKELVNEQKSKNLVFTPDLNQSVTEAELIFICVDVPQRSHAVFRGHQVDLRGIESVARTISEVASGVKVVVDKSSVAYKSVELIESVLKPNIHLEFQVLSNPYVFSKESELQDFLSPDRVLIGGKVSSEGKLAIKLLKEIYEHWVPDEKILTGSIWWSTLTKFAIDAFALEGKSAVNTLCGICELTKVDIADVMRVVGMDSGLGNKFLKPSIGFGDTELKMSLENLIQLCETLFLPEITDYWKGLLKMDDFNKERLSEKIIRRFLTLKDKIIAVFGFQSDSDLIRESLLVKGARIHIYDPNLKQKEVMNDSVFVFNDPYESTQKAHAIVVCSEREDFKLLDYRRIFVSMMKPAYVFDGVDILPHVNLLEIGFIVDAFGKILVAPPGFKGMEVQHLEVDNLDIFL